MTNIKMNDKLMAHLPGYLYRQLVNENENGEMKVRMVDGVVKVTERSYVRYYYKGFEIWQKTSTPVGYYGRWEVTDLGRYGTGTDSLKNCKRLIDEKIASRLAEKPLCSCCKVD